MSTYIPSEITNIILEYYAQLNNLKWQPFIDQKTGKLKWKVNKYSLTYENINKLLEHKKNNLVSNISIDVSLEMGGETINFYDTIGTCISLKHEYFPSTKYKYIPRSILYISFPDDYGFKNYIFCSVVGKSTLLGRMYHDIYQDDNNYGIITYLSSFNSTTYSIVIEKW